MSILILNRNQIFRYAEWLTDIEDNLVLLTEVERSDESDYNVAINIDPIDTNHLLDNLIVELNKKYKFKRIIAHQEKDLVRAAYYRQHFNLKGQSIESALAYRDKYIMKKILRENGMKTAEYNRLEYPIDLIGFIEKHGFPVVVKPVDSAGSDSVDILYDENDMKNWLKLGLYLQRQFILENFIYGDMYHLDGIARNGKVEFCSTSKYINGCLAFNEGLSRGSVMLESKNPLKKRLEIEVQKVISSLPIAESFVFHAEFFYTPNDEIVVCEIASRTGGGRITEAINYAYHLNLCEAWIKLQCSVELNYSDKKLVNLTGYLVIPPKKGVYRYIPVTHPFPWAISYKVFKAENNLIDTPTKSSDALASVIIKGSSEKEIESRIEEFNLWFNKEIEWCSDSKEKEDSIVDNKE